MPFMPIHPTVKSLIEEIDAFRAKARMSVTAFGISAVNDGGFLADLKNGIRNPSLKTMDRVRSFMRKHKETA